MDSISRGGLGSGELGVCIAPTGAGKSMALVHLGAQAILEGKTVVHYTLELADTVVATRYDSCITGIPLTNTFANKDKIYDNAQKEMQSVVKNMTWRKQVRNWLDWKEFFNPETFQMVGKDIATYKKVLAIIKRRKRVSKGQLIGELNWGRQFKFGRYRNRLRLDDRIKFTKNGYEWK